MSVFFVLKHVVLILCTNFNLFNNPSMFLHVLMIFRNSLRMIKTDREMSELLQIVRKNIVLLLLYLLVLLSELKGLVCIYIYIYIYVCVCVYIYIYMD